MRAPVRHSQLNSGCDEGCQATMRVVQQKPYAWVCVRYHVARPYAATPLVCMISVLMLILYYVTYTHAFKCSRSSVILTRQRRATIMTTSRKPLKPLRDFLHHVAKFCLLPRDVRGKRFFQKFVLKYCNAKLPSWHVSNHHDQAMLQCHEIYWQALKRHGGKPCKLAEWCHLLISNRDTNQPWSRWCVHIAACLIDPSYNLVPAKERYGVCLDDGTAFGPGDQRTLFESREKYMGGHEIATYTFEHGVPQFFDSNHGVDVTSSTYTNEAAN